MARLTQASGRVRRGEPGVSAPARPQPPARPFRRWASMVLLGVLAYCGVAQAAHDPDRLQRLVEAEQYEQAFEFAQRHRAEHAGESRFDFYYGIAAIEQGALDEGIFALERVLIAQPGSDRARLELARVYFLRGDHRRARREFETVQAHDPPANVAAIIDRYLLAIERRADRYETTVTGHFEIGGGYDSNVNSATDAQSISILDGFADVPLNNDAREQSDSFGRGAGRINVSHPIAPGLNLLARGGLRGRFNADEDQFNTATLDTSVGALLRRSRWQLEGTLDAARFYLDGDEYREQVGVSTEYRRSLSEWSTAALSFQVADLRYDANEDLDSTLWILGGGLTHTFQTDRRPTLSGRILVGAERADEDSFNAEANAERDLVGVQAGVHLPLRPDWTFRGTAGARASEYAEPGLFTEARDEVHYRLDLALDWRPSARWRVGPHVELTHNESNIELYEYDRALVELRARVEFY